MKKIISYVRKHEERSIAFFYLLLIIAFYCRSLWGYFQGDEWFYFRQFLPLTNQPFGLLKALYKSIFDIQDVSGGGHLTPVYNVSWYLFNKLFSLNYFPYISASILLHTVNTYLVYLLSRVLVKNKYIGLLAGIFFGAAFVHQQAVTWVMAFFPTVISATFFLLSLLCTVYASEKKPADEFRKYIRLTVILALCSFLTKESSVLLFLLIPLILYLKNKKRLNKTFLKYFGLLSLIYLPFRFLLPKLLLFIASQTGNVGQKTAVPWDLHLFRLITYPLRLLTEVFIPARLILSATEFITPYAYPPYAAEKAVRGTNYLTFTQSAGSDILIFSGAIVILFILFQYSFVLKAENRSKYHGALLGFFIIIFSALPLVMIASYAPWWGYVTFIDSRHLYISSVGAALLTGLFVFDAGRLLARKFSVYYAGIRPVHVILFLTVIWLLLQFVLFTQELDTQVHTGSQRRKIISRILEETFIRDKTVFLVTSDMGYYGFGPIPPFQTNLGQILTVFYYAQRGLPIYFLNNNFLAKKGIAGGGYLEHEGKGFGYFTDQNELFQEVRNGTIMPEYISAFTWFGKTDEIKNVTATVRTEAVKYQELLSEFQGWNTYQDPDELFSLAYPQNMLFEDALEEDNTDQNILRNVIIRDVSSGYAAPLDIHIRLIKKTGKHALV